MHSACSDSFQGPRVLDVETLLERELKTSEVQIIQYHKFCRLTTKGISIISAQAFRLCTSIWIWWAWLLVNAISFRASKIEEWLKQQIDSDYLKFLPGLLAPSISIARLLVFYTMDHVFMLQQWAKIQWYWRDCFTGCLSGSFGWQWQQRSPSIWFWRTSLCWQSWHSTSVVF